MKREDIPVLEFVAVLAMVVLAITVATLFFPRDKVGDMATWTGAIGAFLAFGGTIWIATGETRLRKQQALDLARVTAAGMHPRIFRAKRDLDLVIDGLRTRLGANDFQRPFSAYFQQLEEIRLWNSEDVTPLLPLPNHCAARLASVSQHIEICKGLFESADRNPSVISAPREFAETMLAAVLEIQAMTIIALEECRRTVAALEKMDV